MAVSLMRMAAATGVLVVDRAFDHGVFVAVVRVVQRAIECRFVTRRLFGQNDLVESMRPFDVGDLVTKKARNRIFLLLMNRIGGGFARFHLS